MAENIASAQLRLLVQSMETYLKQLDSKDISNLVKRNRDIEGIYERTSHIIKASKIAISNSAQEVLHKSKDNTI
ncbi:unnamed protein product [Blepharisma stoltei]|uniref:Uncharacterized protein n=1 Tax=Blepharisma stoltei TaxID=1481888 RepID=A0AAU9K1K7_9CILI|nr:unnamed protein product [Blepharisma stoltei]